MSTIYIIFIVIAIIVLYYYLLNSTPSGHKVGIASMMKFPHQVITWIKYHLLLNISKIYIFMDDPQDPNIQVIQEYIKTNNMDKVKVIILDELWQKENNYKKDPNKDEPLNWNTRQDLCVNQALKMAKEDHIDIIVHIDSDELLYMQTESDIENIFKKYSNNTFKIKNIELAPDKENYQNCFLEGKYFRKNGDGFIAYGNGKGAGRTGRVRSNGPHEMTTLMGYSNNTQWIENDELLVLHYVSCNLEEFLKKYKLYANFSSNKWEWAKFHLSARDELKECKDKECEEKAKNLFRKRMKNEKDVIFEVDINKVFQKENV